MRRVPHERMLERVDCVRWHAPGGMPAPTADQRVNTAMSEFLPLAVAPLKRVMNRKTRDRAPHRSEQHGLQP